VAAAAAAGGGAVMTATETDAEMIAMAIETATVGEIVTK